MKSASVYSNTQLLNTAVVIWVAVCGGRQGIVPLTAPSTGRVSVCTAIRNTPLAYVSSSWWRIHLPFTQIVWVGVCQWPVHVDISVNSRWPVPNPANNICTAPH